MKKLFYVLLIVVIVGFAQLVMSACGDCGEMWDIVTGAQYTHGETNIVFDRNIEDPITNCPQGHCFILVEGEIIARYYYKANSAKFITLYDPDNHNDAIYWLYFDDSDRMTAIQLHFS